ncbi:hypothetical protein PRIPAC_83231 [Pristionchus pacificus]|uniref:Uncharacterized protein n=1 Tax=Pristionchus pacificus TaxID=54126 RepID=A0A2A6BUL3_PRIPA|nr:hypothetical protein PRIPAC_83231 [Pristionchus pacificus]|eukprot:PDM69547.1 hypothetical protein PRIPAC_44643 [Pristionchus pacificus]
MGDGRLTIMLVLFLFAHVCHSEKKPKFSDLPVIDSTRRIKFRKWSGSKTVTMKADVRARGLNGIKWITSAGSKNPCTKDSPYIPYKHEIVTQGGLRLDIGVGSNYTVFQTTGCYHKPISLIIQLDPPGVKDMNDMHQRQQKTCTISILIDDGHIEVWYGLCMSRKEKNKRKFDFAVTYTSIVYFNFDKLTMRMYKQEGDDGQVFEMGRVEHVTEDKTHEEFIDFVMFLHFDTCKHVYLKETFSEDAWRNIDEKEIELSNTGDPLLNRMMCIFFTIQSITCLILSTMYVWSIGIPFFTNRLYDMVFLRYTKEGVVVKSDEAEADSCKTVEEPSQEWEATSGRKEDLFGEKGKQKAPMRAPPGYALSDYEEPYKDDPETVMITALAKEDDPAWDGKVEATPPTKTDRAAAGPSEKSSKILALLLSPMDCGPPASSASGSGTGSGTGANNAAGPPDQANPVAPADPVPAPAENVRYCRGAKIAVPDAQKAEGNTNIHCERHFWGTRDKHWIEVNGPDKSAPIGVHFSKEKLEEGVIECVKATSDSMIVRCQGDNCDKHMGISAAFHACRVKQGRDGVAAAPENKFKEDEARGTKIGLSVGVPFVILLFGGLACFGLVKCLTREVSAEGPPVSMTPSSVALIPSKMESVQAATTDPSTPTSKTPVKKP